MKNHASTHLDPKAPSEAARSVSPLSAPASVGWVEEFTRRQGRAPRILHIGNIANNAYVNASLLNGAGFDCDVLCPDYYHVMGCPEWEDADFHGPVRDQFHPDWRHVDLHGFVRPAWFTQGPLTFCILYLIARREERQRAAVFFWRLISIFNRTYPQRNASRWLCPIAWFWWLAAWGLRLTLALGSRTPGLVRSPTDRQRLAQASGPLSRCVAHGRWLGRVLIWLLALPLWGLAFLCLGGTVCLSLGRFPPWERAWLAASVRRLMGRAGANPYRTQDQAQAENLNAAFRSFYPGRPEPFSISDGWVLGRTLPLLRELLSHYDVIQAYATSTVYPLLCGNRPYVAYEHGTIREIPFAETNVGRQTAISYRLANYCIVTNPDCIHAARKLELPQYRYVPHVLGPKYFGPFQAGSRKPVVFCPSRHDWQIKGTDLVIRGFAEFASQQREVNLLMTNWGEDVARSKQLILELGLQDRVDFVDPMPVRRMIQAMQSASAVIDQFKGYFGAIAPAALAVGTPLIMHLDFADYAWCWDQPPPYYEAVDAAGVARGIGLAVGTDLQRYADESRQWVQRNYWYGNVVTDHASIYEQLIATP